MSRFVSRHTIIAGLLIFGLSASAFAAQPPSVGLGQSWPNAPDVSPSPSWHTYAFVLNGVRYIQVNDLNGKVIGAVAASGGQFLVLPIGSDAQYVATPQQSAATTASTTAQATPQTVYQDSTTQITATVQSTGAVLLNATTTGTCDPVECSSHVN